MFACKISWIWPPKIHVLVYKCLNDQKKKRERSERAILFRVIWLCMSCVLCFFEENGNLKVKIDVCVRYNRISANCVLTLCVLRTVLNPPENCVPKGGVTLLNPNFNLHIYIFQYCCINNLILTLKYSVLTKTPIEMTS